MKHKFFCALTAAIMLSFSQVQASIDMDVRANFSNNTMVVNGKYDKDMDVTIQIIKKEIGLEDFAESETPEVYSLYVNSTKTDKNGNYTFTAEIDQSGDYVVYVCGNDIDTPISKEILNYKNSSDYEAAVTYVNGATGEADFVNKLTEKLADLDLDLDINSNINVADSAKLMYSELPENKQLIASEFQKNKRLYEDCAVITALNAGKTTDTMKYLENIVNDDVTLKAYYDKHVNQEDKENYLLGKMSGKGITNIVDLKNKLTEGIILTAVMYPDGYMNINTIFNEYKTTLGLSSVSAADGVYLNLAGKSFNSITELVSAYNVIVSQSGSQSSGGSSGRGSSNISVSTPDISVSTPSIGDSSQNSEIEMIFNDISTVRWAYSSISVLYNKGIISGKGDNRFYPEDTVKREEFVKMMISAIGLQTESTNVFSDVEQNMWYAPYIGAAYDNGLVNGINANEFGIGRNITRQDMAVMLYNAIKMKGYVDVGADYTFADAADIAGYAKTAVAELTAAGIVNGMGDNMYMPAQTATRVQAAVIIERALSYLQ